MEDESRCLLVVEDDSLTAALLSEVLVAQGFEVEVAQTAADARRVLDEFAPDAALLDIVLGDGPSGVGLAHLIAREYPATAVLFLTRFRDAHAAGLVTMDMPAGCPSCARTASRTPRTWWTQSRPHCVIIPGSSATT